MKLGNRIKKALRENKGVRLSAQELALLCGSYVPLHSGDRLKDALYLAGYTTSLNQDANIEMNIAFYDTYKIDLNDVVEEPTPDLRDRQAMLNGLDCLTATPEDLDEWVMEYHANRRAEQQRNSQT